MEEGTVEELTLGADMAAASESSTVEEPRSSASPAFKLDAEDRAFALRAYLYDEMPSTASEIHMKVYLLMQRPILQSQCSIVSEERVHSLLEVADVPLPLLVRFLRQRVSGF